MHESFHFRLLKDSIKIAALEAKTELPIYDAVAAVATCRSDDVGINRISFSKKKVASTLFLVASIQIDKRPISLVNPT